MTTLGKYYPNKLLATEEDPPLSLRVTASTQEALQAAVRKINESMERSSTFDPSTTTSFHSEGVCIMAHLMNINCYSLFYSF